MKSIMKITKALLGGGLVILLVFTVVGNVAAQTCVQPPTGLVSWWDGDGNANDIWDGNDGTLQNGATFAAGMVGQAFSFDGVDDEVEIPDNDTLDISTHDLTYSLWVRPSTPTGTYQTVLAKGETIGNFEYILYYEPAWPTSITDAFRCIWWNTADVDYLMVTSSQNYPENQWHHVTCVLDNANNEVRLFINGILEGIDTTTSGTAVTGNSEPLMIGRRGTTIPFAGIVDELMIFDRALTASEIQAIFNAGSAGMCKPEPVCVAPPSGMVSWWPGDGNANDIQDGNDGTLMNGATTASGKVGQAFSFDGVDDFVNVPHAVNLNIQSSFTWDAWINPNSIGNSPVIASKSAATFNRVGFEVLSDGSLCGYFDLHTCNIQSGPGVVTPGQFTHVAFVFDDVANTLRLYADGILVATAAETSSPAGNTASLTIGKSGIFGGFEFNGLIDEFEIFDRSLTAAEIQAIFNAGSAGKCKDVQPNNPPVASCQNVTVSAGTDCTADASINDGSSDPDGDPITITQDPAGPYWLGDTVVTLTVTDDSGESDSCTATVTVEDNSCPTVTAKLVPVKVKKKKGCFRVELSVVDNCDENPQVVATINGTNGAGVVNGQLVELKHKKKFKVKTEDGDSGNSDDDSKSHDDDGGSDDCGTLRFEGSSFTLTATAIDNAGNLACEEAVDIFIFIEDDSSSHKK